MRPLVVFTGQGIARADGFNLTRRLKGLPHLATLGDGLARGVRQNLDALVAAQAQAGDAAMADLLRAVRALCLKERRSTLRKTAHREVFACLAAAAAERLVVHVTACIDGLTTTFAVRDFDATWPPFRGVTSLREVRAAAATRIRSRRGLLHLPAHGEAPLVVSLEDEPRLQSFFGEPEDLRGPAPWAPSLRLALGRGVAEMEAAFPLARLAYEAIEALVSGEPGDLGPDEAVPGGPPADLLVIGYGAGSPGPAPPFERRVAALHARRQPHSPARWTALVYRPGRNRRVAAWFETHGFSVAAYGDGDLPDAVRRALDRPRTGERVGGTTARPTPTRSAQA